MAKEFRTQRISILDYSAIIFNARHGIDHFFRLCDEMRISIPETMKYFCVTEAVAVYLQHYIHYRKRKVFFGKCKSRCHFLEQRIKNKEQRIKSKE